MKSTTANFQTANNLLYKHPVYLVAFDGESTDYTTIKDPGSLFDNTVKAYLDNVSGSGQQVTPEEGIASISDISFDLLDKSDEITLLLSTDTDAYFHRRKTIVKAGYKGLDESDFATIMTAGRVTGLKLSADGTAWKFQVTDPRKYEQERIFLGSEDSTLTISGNPIDILLSVYLSSDTPGTNHATYDRLGDGNGLNLTTDDIDVTDLELLRDNWFPGNSHYMKFSITERETASDFITTQIRKVLNLRPVITGDGKMTEKPFKPPLANSAEAQSFTEDNVIGLPSFDTNLQATINRVEFFTDYDGDEYQVQDYYVDATSLLNRGPGKKPISIKSRGLHASLSPGSMNSFTADVLLSRKRAIFARYSSPPTKIIAKTHFTKWLTEAGDVVPFTHSKLPDIVSGTRGYSSTLMEVVDRQVKWKNGEVTVGLLDTGFTQGTYGVISPTMTVTAAASGTEWTVSVTDAAKYANLTTPEVAMYDSAMRVQVAAKTITDVNTTTGVITSDNWGETPTVGYIIAFANYDSCTDEQKNFGFIGVAESISLAPTSCCTDPDNDVDVTTGWSIGNSAVLSSEAGGDTGNCLKVLESGANSPNATKDAISVTPGDSMKFSFKHKDIDGTSDDPIYGIWDNANAAWIAYTTVTANAAWTQIEYLFEVPAGAITLKLLLVHSATSADGDAYYFDDVTFKKQNSLGTALDDAHLIVP